MIKVFKFGGASLKDSVAMKNAAGILENFEGHKILLVVSAMGKTTNAMEILHKCWFENKSCSDALENIRSYHFDIINELFLPQHKVFDEVLTLFNEISTFVSKERNVDVDFDKSYDQLIPYGELLSSCILSNFLLSRNKNASMLDSRKYIKADELWREAKILWDETYSNINASVRPMFQDIDIIVTQGFIASTLQNETITLGREGSDFSASIFAYCLNSDSVTIWKDVPGLFNADPKEFKDVQLIPHVSYREAVELAYYGQSIIHPKTIKPLQNKNIPLFIKSFVDPQLPGSVIDNQSDDDTNVPSYILKKSQILVSVFPKDFSFINEQSLKEIFNSLAKARIKINVMQNSALSFSFCSDMNEHKLNIFKNDLKDEFLIKYNANLELITIRNYTDQIIEKLTSNKEVILEQKSRVTAQLVVSV